MSKEEYGVGFPRKVYQLIFSRLPALILRCVSKLCNSLVSPGSSFINRTFNSGNSLSSSNPWIFMDDPSDEQVQLYLKHSQEFIDLHDGLSFEFLLDTDPFRTEGIQKAYILSSSSNGLVLYSAEKPVSFPAEENTRFYYVCNPMTKQWVSLPPRPESNGSDHKRLYCAELVFDASISHSNYKVVYIDADHYTGYLPQKPINLQVHIFSSDTGEWKSAEVPLPDIQHVFSDMAIHRGVLYWTAEERLTCKKILIAYNPENGCNECTKFAFPKQNGHSFWGESNISFFGESQGSIYYGIISDGIDYDDARTYDYHFDDKQTRYRAFLDVWRLEDDYSINGGLNWQMMRQSIELKGYRSSKKVEVIYINPVDRNVFIIVDRGCCLAYNVTTLTHEVLHGCPIPTKIKEHYKLRPIFITPKPTVIPSNYSGEEELFCVYVPIFTLGDIYTYILRELQRCHQTKLIGL